MLENNQRKEISQLGKFGLIEQLSAKFHLKQPSSILGIGCDAVVIKPTKNNVVSSSRLFLENIHFDLTYFPLKHLGYKSVAVALSDILAMNAIPSRISVNLAVSNRFSIEAMQEIMDGIFICCKNYSIDLVGLDVNASQSGLVISVTSFGEADADSVIRRDGAKDKELICVSGDFGAAYAGLVLLEREKKVFEVNPDMQPDLSGYDYLLERQLKPEPRFDIIMDLQKSEILPTSMINISDGIASALIHICNASHSGCTIYENKIPVDSITFNTLKELKIVATTVALNGGEDYELLFTVKQEDFEKINKLKNISVIGYIHEESAGKNLITNDECLLPLKAQGFVENIENDEI
jgi:thiamine-monophosphate kinase